MQGMQKLNVYLSGAVSLCGHKLRLFPLDEAAKISQGTGVWSVCLRVFVGQMSERWGDLEEPVVQRGMETVLWGERCLCTTEIKTPSCLTNNIYGQDTATV